MQKLCNLNKTQETQQRTGQVPQNNQKNKVVNVKVKRCVTVQIRHSEKRICELEDGSLGEFPGGPAVQTLCFQCRGHRFCPWLGN